MRVDLSTWHHSLRVSALVGYLSDREGAGREAVVEAVRAGLLHDVGKATLAPSILNKPGLLSPEEWEAMKGHPKIGYNLLLPLQGICAELTPQLMHAVLYHHERENGAGYYGLDAPAIPDLAAALAVADVWDAVSQSRSYRPAYKHEKAVAILRTSQLRPKYVTSLLELVNSDEAASD